MRNTNIADKENTLGNVLRVQHVIDCMVLGELIQNGKQYNDQLEQFIIKKLHGTGVNNAYLSKRMKVLHEKGHVNRTWDGDNRFNRFYTITDSGQEYFVELKREMIERITLAKKVYGLFEAYVKEFDGIQH